MSSIVDRAEIIVRGGNGGDGLVSFRREKFIPFGGPDGGDGGNGGDVLIMVGSSIDDLSLLRQRKKFVAKSGDVGGKWKKYGKKGEDLIILVPVGTMVFIEDESKEKRFVADLVVPGQRVLVAKGGSGGLGNIHFATAVNQAPQIASKGEVGEGQYIILELKLITDICIIGYPNSGKSALLSTITRAKPKVADYPFTTGQPALGVIQNDRREFVVAEMPGLVEGAHKGIGVGNEFLRHAERAKLLIYLLDGNSMTIAEDFSKLSDELALYGADLGQKPGIVAVNKVDLPQVQARLPDIKQSLGFLDVPLFFISAVDGQGISELINKATEMVQRESQNLSAIASAAKQSPIAVFRPKPKKRGDR
jgi:GTP-binding protein